MGLADSVKVYCSIVVVVEVDVEVEVDEVDVEEVEVDVDVVVEVDVEVVVEVDVEDVEVEDVEVDVRCMLLVCEVTLVIILPLYVCTCFGWQLFSSPLGHAVTLRYVVPVMVVPGAT